ncbi:hypothetical protein OV079_34170 [Nannocystis pusilla]|uniref:Uncharacterized protein n=1 Tax=Nannocystis pusilla TaxID=889268 RepID=A0A9X3J0Y2_9BACT|nr:hypothetical protein [Nannocystis pusilla]MCY1010525.1 hypothetical protein [Nannocystis pusilla]
MLPLAVAPAGEGWDAIGYGTLDFSARSIVEGHIRGVFPHRAGMMCIANDTAKEQPQLRYYDLAHPSDQDAPVFVAGPEEDDFEPEFETLRELIASAVFDNHRLRPMPFRCEGLLVAEDGEEASQTLAPLLAERGFDVPVACGPLCLLYDDGTIAFSSYRSPAWPTPQVIPFNLGGPSPGSLRKFLGMVSTSTHLVVENLVWAPRR